MSKKITTIPEIINWVNTEIKQLTETYNNIHDRIDLLDESYRDTSALWDDVDIAEAKRDVLIKALNKIDTKTLPTDFVAKCPRCGEPTLKMPLSTNALSRHIPGAYVCDNCGTKEALEDFNNAKKESE